METRTIGFDLPKSKQFFRELEDRARALPGVQSVSIAASVPLGYSSRNRPVYIEGQAATSKEALPAFFITWLIRRILPPLRIPLLRGRLFTEQDTDKTPLVAVINEAMAKKFWPNQDPLGKRFSAKSASGRSLK